MGRAGPQVIVDENRAVLSGLHAGRIQPERVCIRCPASGNQQTVGLEHALLCRKLKFITDIIDLAGFGVFQHPDAFFPENLCHTRTDRGVFPKKQRAARQDRDPTTQAGKGLRQFEGDDRGADHRQAIGDGLAFQGLSGGPEGRVLKARDGRDRRAGTGRDQAPVKGQGLFCAGLSFNRQRARVDKMRLATDQRNFLVGIQNGLVPGLTQFLHPGLLLREEFFPVDGRRCGRDAVIERAAGAHMGNMGRLDHDLRRHAADVDAGAAQRTALDHGHPGTGLECANGGRERATAAADDGDMQPVVVGDCDVLEHVVSGHVRIFTT